METKNNRVEFFCFCFCFFYQRLYYCIELFTVVFVADGEHGNGLKLEKKLANFFQVLRLSWKKLAKNVLWALWIALPVKFHLISSSQFCSLSIFYRSKGAKQWKAKNWPKRSKFPWHCPFNYKSRAVAKGLLRTIFCCKLFWSVFYCKMVSRPSLEK